MERISRDQLFMTIAETFATRGTCPRAQVGCVIVNDRHHILSHGYNGALHGMSQCDEIGCGGAVYTHANQPFAGSPAQFPNGCTRAVHAEANAIYYAASLGIPLAGTTMYTTHEPCRTCAQAIIAAHIAEVIYHMPYRIHEGLALLRESGVHVSTYLTLDEREAGRHVGG